MTITGDISIPPTALGGMSLRNGLRTGSVKLWRIMTKGRREGTLTQERITRKMRINIYILKMKRRIPATAPNKFAKRITLASFRPLSHGWF
jgi:hypothetical protein